MSEFQEMQTLYALTPEQIIQFLSELYNVRIPVSVLIIGDRGIGKSQSVRDAAKKIAKDLGREFIDYDDSVADKILESPEKYFVFVDFRLTETEPSDLIGIPRPENGHVVYKPLKWAVVLSKVPGILFLDELNMVQRPDVETAMFKILNDGKVGFTKLLGWSEHYDNVPVGNRGHMVLIVGAGNDPSQNPLAKYLTVQVMGRIMKLNAKTPKIEEWINWMNRTHGDNWDKTVAAFLLKNPDFFHVKARQSRTLEVLPEPRKWTKVALVSNVLRGEMLEVAIRGLVGIEAAENFLVFKSLNIPDESVVLQNPKMYSSLKLDAQRLLISQIAQNFDVSNLDKYKKFVKYLYENDKESLLIMMMLMGKKLKMWLKKALVDKEWSYVLKFAVEAEKIKIELDEFGGI